MSVKVLDVGRYCTLADTTMLQYYNTEYRQNQHYPAQPAVLLPLYNTQHLQGLLPVLYTRKLFVTLL